MHYFDMDGNPCDEFPENWVVKKTVLENGLLVSTVLLGIDHNFDGFGPPVIFETMVFKKDSESLDCERYCTKADAMLGHFQMIEKWGNAIVSDEKPASEEE